MSVEAYRFLTDSFSKISTKISFVPLLSVPFEIGLKLEIDEVVDFLKISIGIILPNPNVDF